MCLLGWFSWIKPFGISSMEKLWSGGSITVQINCTFVVNELMIKLVLESRLLRNRVSAQQARERKKVYVNDLESRAQELQDRNSKLEEKISTLVNENTMLRKVRPQLYTSLIAWVEIQFNQSHLTPIFNYLSSNRSSWTLGLRWMTVVLSQSMISWARAEELLPHPSACHQINLFLNLRQTHLPNTWKISLADMHLAVLHDYHCLGHVQCHGATITWL